MMNEGLRVGGLARLALVIAISLSAWSVAPVSASVPNAQAAASAQADMQHRLDDLSDRVNRLENRVGRGTSGAVLFLFGAFCALWAQNTKRDPWAWFFLGAVFNVFAVLALLSKNAEGQSSPSAASKWSRAFVIVLGVLVIATFALLYYWSLRST